MNRIQWPFMMDDGDHGTQRKRLLSPVPVGTQVMQVIDQRFPVEMSLSIALANGPLEVKRYIALRYRYTVTEYGLMDTHRQMRHPVTLVKRATKLNIRFVPH
jgi:hypothetical protein